MAIKTIPLFFAFLAVLLTMQTVSCKEENEQYDDKSDLLYIENPDSDQIVLSPAQALLDSPTRNRVCISAICQRICRSRNFIFGRCNSYRICVCSNF